jgi:hypothetical protein
MATLKEMLQTGAAAAPSEAVLSALITALSDERLGGKGLKKAFKLLQYSTTEDVPVASMPSSEAVVAFLRAMLGVGPDEGSVDTAQVRKTPLFAPFISKNDLFTKTGSGQT